MTTSSVNSSTVVSNKICDYPTNSYNIIKYSAMLGWHDSSIISNIRFNSWDSQEVEGGKKLDKKSVDDVFSLFGINYVNVPSEGISQSLFNKIIDDKKKVISLEQELCSVRQGGHGWYLMQSVKIASNPISLIIIFIFIILSIRFLKKKRRNT